MVAVACFTRYRELIAEGECRAHAIHFFVPGILNHFDKVRQIFRLYGAGDRFRSIIYPGVARSRNISVTAAASGGRSL